LEAEDRTISAEAWPPWAIRVACGIIALGAVLRLRLYLADRSLWVDEASLALNVLGRSIGGLWRPLDFLQAAPVGFLMLQKVTVSLLGGSEYALRLVPLMAGLISLPLFLALARRTVGPMAGLVGLAMMSLSKGLIYYSSEAKQYSTDVVCCLLILLATLHALRGGGRARRMAWFAVTGVFAIWFSHPSVFVFGGAAVTLLAAAFATRNRRWIKAIVIALTAAFISSAANYWLLLRPLRHSSALHDFWAREGFMPWPIAPRSFLWLWNTFFRAYGTPGGIKVPAFLHLLLLIGAVVLLYRSLALLLMLLLPPLLALMAAALHQYPYFHRLTLFALPMYFLLAAVGFEWLARLSAGKWRRVAVILGCAVLFGGSLLRAGYWLRRPEPVEEIKPVLAFLQSRIKPDDRIYTNSGARPAVTYYAPRYGLERRMITFGVSGDEQQHARDLELLRDAPRVWLVVSHTQPGDETLYLRVLDRMGRQVEQFRADDGQSDAAAHLYLITEGRALSVDP
jgi:hypothetical protein